MASADRAELVRSMFAAFNAKDRRTAERLLADAFTFTSPYDDAIDRAAYFERCWPNAELILKHDIERIFVEGDEAFVTYTCVNRDGTEFRNTEFFTFDGDRISSVSVYFGASYKDGSFVKQS